MEEDFYSNIQIPHHQKMDTLFYLFYMGQLNMLKHGFGKEEIGQILNQMGVHYVVSQPNFWNDQEKAQAVVKGNADAQALIAAVKEEGYEAALAA